MYGSTTGLESADPGRSGDAEASQLADELRQIQKEKEITGFIHWLLEEAEWKAAREVEDAFGRWKAREGQRRREGLHGKDPAKAEEVAVG
jgi:hypothetical protein